MFTTVLVMVTMLLLMLPTLCGGPLSQRWRTRICAASVAPQPGSPQTNSAHIGLVSREARLA